MRSRGTGTRPLEDGLVLDLKFNEGAGAILHDSSGNRNHGAFGAGAAAPTWATGWMKESKHAELVYEDDETIWAYENGGSGSIELEAPVEETTTVDSGESSTKLVVKSGSYSWCNIYEVYSPSVDWSSQDYIIVKLYGNNSGGNYNIRILAPDFSNYANETITNNWTGWKLIPILLSGMVVTGAPDFSDVASFRLYPPYVIGNYYLDRVVVDVAQSVLEFDLTNDKVTFTSITIDVDSATIAVLFTVNGNHAANYGNTGFLLNKDGSKTKNYLGIKDENTTYPGLLGETNLNGERFVSVLEGGAAGIIKNSPHLIVCVFNAKTVTTYVDNVLVDTRVVTTDITLDCLGGAEPAAPGCWFGGDEGMVKIWNIPLSREDVALLNAQRRRV